MWSVLWIRDPINFVWEKNLLQSKRLLAANARFFSSLVWVIEGIFDGGMIVRFCGSMIVRLNMGKRGSNMKTQWLLFFKNKFSRSHDSWHMIDFWTGREDLIDSNCMDYKRLHRVLACSIINYQTNSTMTGEALYFS